MMCSAPATLPIIVSVCGDPGGASALAPVLRALENEGRVELRAYAYAEGVESLARAGVRARTLTEPPSRAFLDDALNHGGVAAVLVGTSVNTRNWEHPFVRHARALGVPSMALLDFWTNYRARFSDDDSNLTAVPDKVAVMDERAAEGLRRTGLPASAIVITGQPAFDELAVLRASMTNERREQLRREVGMQDDDLLVLFASQPFRALRGTLEDMGYDEEGVLDVVIPALESAARLMPGRTTLLIRPHPREDLEHHIMRTSSTLRILVSREGDGREWAMAADLVIGMCTALLIEACYLGAAVLSVQPGLLRPDPVPTNAVGLSTGIYATEDVAPTVARMLMESASRPSRQALALPSAATSRVVDCVYSLVALRHSASI